jgi:hypothetical protein
MPDGSILTEELIMQVDLTSPDKLIVRAAFLSTCVDSPK